MQFYVHQGGWSDLTDAERVAFFELGPDELYSTKLGEVDNNIALYRKDFYLEWDMLHSALQVGSLG